MGGGGPDIKSDAEIAEDARMEEERIKFQGEKRTFLENVARYELLATDARKAHESTFEYQIPGSWNPGGAGNGGSMGSGLFVPAKFNPSFDDSARNKVNTSIAGQSWSNQEWFNSPNLGLFNPFAENKKNGGDVTKQYRTVGSPLMPMPLQTGETHGQWKSPRGWRG